LILDNYSAHISKETRAWIIRGARADFATRLASAAYNRAEAKEAVGTLIRWAGDVPDREGLIETPTRVARAYEQWFAGYSKDPKNSCDRPSRRLPDMTKCAVTRHPLRVRLRASHGANHWGAISAISRTIESWGFPN
jgi:hypothetical protein